MKSVRIPAKVAREIKESLFFCIPHSEYNKRLIDVLEAALKPKKFVVAAKKRVKARKADKREETASIREAVFARAQGLCEMCEAPATDLEHAFGRVKVPQAVSNCLALCRNCHIERTNNRPSSKHWWGKYTLHFERHGYAAEQRMTAALYNKRAE